MALILEVMQILYTSDLHGNETQYRALVNFATKNSVRAIIIGGDIAPKHFPEHSYIQQQREFLKVTLPQLLAPLLPHCQVYLMMGNDDCSANVNIIEQNPKLYYIQGRRLQLSGEIDLVGYSYVPITPFGIKDWEKYDLSTVPPQLAMRYNIKKEEYQLEGVKSKATGWEPFVFDPRTESVDSIQRDLKQQVFTENPSRTIYVIHTPPEDTHLDQVRGGKHVGSMAVRLFIEQRQPYLTLHGHIHETVEVSGDFKERIGNTFCFSSGNHNVGSKVAAILFDLNHPENARRILI